MAKGNRSATWDTDIRGWSFQSVAGLPNEFKLPGQLNVKKKSGLEAWGVA